MRDILSDWMRLFECKSRILPAAGTILLFLAASILIKCSSPETETERGIVATVGDRTITAEEFKLNYEFGFSALKKGRTTAERKRTYLDWLINEKLLALEGYGKGLHKTENVRKQEELLKEDLLIETLLQREIRDTIEVNDSEIREAVNKSKVQFKFRYWPVRSEEEARILASEMKSRGFGDVVGSILEDNPETGLTMEDFTSDYMTWLEVPEEVLAVIQDVPLGDISKPVKLQNSYFLFQLLDIRREAVTTNEYLSKAPTLKKVLANKKFGKAITGYISNMMTPKDVTTKGDALRMLADALLEWKRKGLNKQESFLTSIESAVPESPALYQVKNSRDRTLSTFSEGQMTVGDFLDDYKGNRFRSVMQDTNSIRARLSTEIGLHIRNTFLVKKARDLGLDEEAAFQNELRRWRDKWVMEEMISELTEPGDQAHSEDYRKVAVRQVNQVLENLKEKYSINVNSSLLDSIAVNDTPKSRWLDVHIFRSGTNRMAVPIASSFWALQDTTRF